MLDKNPWQAGQRKKQLPFKHFKEKKIMKARWERIY